MGHDGVAVSIEGGTAPGAVRRAAAALAAALAGAGPALALLAPPCQQVPERIAVPTGTAVVLATSGSSGRPRRVALATDALLASAHATHARLGGPGRWLLALPIHHVAGWQVLVRAHVSAAAGTDRPLAVVAAPSFRPGPFAAAVRTMPDGAPRYAALVPTQLARVLADDDATDALASLDAVLIGGAATPPDLAARARAAGARLVTTYGMTETGGGCVYDGVPLDGVSVAAVAGRLEVSGPTLALGYLDDDPDGAFGIRDGRRWFRTGDLGAVDADGRVSVLGRADAALLTGGETVHPEPVEAVLRDHPAVAEAVVVGVPDPEWGARVTALVVLVPGAAVPALDEVRALVGARLGRVHAPREVVVVEELPRAALGKVDRAASTALAAAILAGAART